MNVHAADGARIAYRVDGPSERVDTVRTVVLLNSLGTNLHMWEPQVGPLGRQLRVVRCDCRGHGESEVRPGPYTIEMLGQDLISLLDALALERVDLCGLSLGGMIALWVAAHHPRRVDRAVFANTAAKIATADTWNARIAAVESGGMAAVSDAVLGRFLSSGFRARQPEVTRSIAEMVQGTHPRGYAAACAAVRDADLHSSLSGIRAPSLVIGAEWDESTPLAKQEELHAGISGSRCVVVKESAHLSNVEQSDQFTAHVLDFLLGRPGGPRS